MSQKPLAKWISNKKSIIFGLLERPIITWNEFMFNTRHSSHTLYLPFYTTSEWMDTRAINAAYNDWRTRWRKCLADERTRTRIKTNTIYSVRTCVSLRILFHVNFVIFFPHWIIWICTWTTGKLKKKLRRVKHSFCGMKKNTNKSRNECKNTYIHLSATMRAWIYDLWTVYHSEINYWVFIIDDGFFFQKKIRRIYLRHGYAENE